VLLLLESSNKDGLLTKFLSDHDEGIIGVSIEVADLGKARQLAQSDTEEAGNLRRLLWHEFSATPEVTHRVWMEMFQVEQHGKIGAYPAIPLRE